jgi:SAM-dependent methyltransferase
MAWEELGRTYDTIAAKYEARFLDELADAPYEREMLTEFATATSDPVVEIGSGPGQIGAYVRGHGRRVVGLDRSAAMANLANGRLDGAVNADMRALPFPSECFGGVVAFYSLIHLQRAELVGVLTELHRVLRDGGGLLFSVHEGADVVEADEFLEVPVPFIATFFELDELVEASRAAGFSVTQARRRLPYPTERTVRLHVRATKAQA